MSLVSSRDVAKRKWDDRKLLNILFGTQQKQTFKNSIINSHSHHTHGAEERSVKSYPILQSEVLLWGTLLLLHIEIRCNLKAATVLNEMFKKIKNWCHNVSNKFINHTIYSILINGEVILCVGLRYNHIWPHMVPADCQKAQSCRSGQWTWPLLAQVNLQRCLSSSCWKRLSLGAGLVCHRAAWWTVDNSLFAVELKEEETGNWESTECLWSPDPSARLFHEAEVWCSRSQCHSWCNLPLSDSAASDPSVQLL